MVRTLQPYRNPQRRQHYAEELGLPSSGAADLLQVFRERGSLGGGLSLLGVADWGCARGGRGGRPHMILG